MADGDSGTNFNFAELTYPGALISKAMLLTSSPPVTHTNDVSRQSQRPPSLARGCRAVSCRVELAPLQQVQGLDSLESAFQAHVDALRQKDVACAANCGNGKALLGW